MAGSSQVDGLRALAEPLAADAGLVVEDITITPAGKRRVLRIVVDLPQDRTGGVGMQSVAEISRSLAAALETSDVMGAAPFVLEVTSPGINRPLVERRHWMRARGRLVKADPVAGVTGWTSAISTGRLTAVDDAGIELDGERRLGWEQISRGQVQVEFGRTEELADDQADDDQADDDQAEHELDDEHDESED